MEIGDILFYPLYCVKHKMTKPRYRKMTFNLPFGGYGTFVIKESKIGQESVIREQINMGSHEDPFLYQDYSGRELFSLNEDKND